MQTNIHRTADGAVDLTVSGDSDPAAVALKYLEVRDKLFPPTEGKEVTKDA